MPTRLGNILRASEVRIAGRYGLDPMLCWSAFWLVLPELARTELTEARTAVDTRVRTWFWALLFCVWALVTWWWPPLLIGLVLAVVVYAGWLLPAAGTYADLLDAAFEVHRGALYKAFGRTLPTDLDAEASAGASLTELIWHGTAVSTAFSAASLSDLADPPEGAESGE